MAEVLDYSRLKTGRRLHENIDWDLLGLSLVQIGAWGFYLFSQARDDRPFWVDRVSLFGFAWRYNRANPFDPIVSILASLIVIFTAVRPVAKRAASYRVYTAMMMATIVLHVASGQYIVSQCPGAWGSLLLRSYNAERYTTVGWVFVFHPLFWVLLTRAALPRKLNPNALYSLIFLVLIVVAFALLVVFPLVINNYDRNTAI